MSKRKMNELQQAASLPRILQPRATRIVREGEAIYSPGEFFTSSSRSSTAP